MRAPWLLGLIALLATGCLHRKPKVQGFQAVVTQQELQLLDESLAGAQARFAATIQGPHRAHIDGASWQVSWNGKVIDRGSQTVDVPFGNDGIAPLTLVISVPWARTASELSAVADQKKVKLEIAGSFHFSEGISEGSGTFSTSKDVVPPHLPTVKLVSTDGARFNTGEAAVLLTLEVKNPNDFPLLINEAPYVVTLGGARPSEGVGFAGETIPANGTSRYDVRAYLDPPSEDPDDWPKRVQTTYALKGAVRGALYDVHFDFSGTVKLRAGR